MGKGLELTLPHKAHNKHTAQKLNLQPGELGNPRQVLEAVLAFPVAIAIIIPTDFATQQCLRALQEHEWATEDIEHTHEPLLL